MPDDKDTNKICGKCGKTGAKSTLVGDFHDDCLEDLIKQYQKDRGVDINVRPEWTNIKNESGHGIDMCFSGVGPDKSQAHLTLNLNGLHFSSGWDKEWSSNSVSIHRKTNDLKKIKVKTHTKKVKDAKWKTFTFVNEEGEDLLGVTFFEGVE